MKILTFQSIGNDVPREKAFAFIADPNQLPRWTNAFASVNGRRAILRTPNGEVGIELDVIASEKEGTIDWRLAFPEDSTGVAYSRVTKLNADSCVYSFVLTPPPVALEQLEGALA